MDENYLNIPSRQSIEAYIDTLESYRNDNDPATDYSQTYLTIKKSQIMEQVDARSRLATIENKEAIDALEERLERLEQPTKRLVPVGKQLGSVYFPRHWVKYPVYGNGIWLIASGDSSTIYVSKDNGKTVQSLDPTDTDECIFTNDSSSSATFKYCEIAFKNNKFFIYSNTGKLYETTNAYEFAKVNCAISEESPGFFIEDDSNNTLLLWAANDQSIYKYDENEDNWILLGQTDWAINSSGFCRVINFSNKLYIRDWKDKLSILSDNYLSHTKIQFNSTIEDTFASSDPDRIFVENNILFVSCTQDIIYTENGEDWNILNVPEESRYMNTTTGIKLTYLASNNSYYGIIKCAGSASAREKCGLYKWTSLNSTPECISDSTFGTYIYNGLSDIINIDGILYCSIKVTSGMFGYRIFKIVDDVITNTGFQAEYGIHPCQEYGYNTNSGQTTIVTKINDRLYIVSGYNCSYREEDIYALEDYTPTGNETNTIVATF